MNKKIEKEKIKDYLIILSYVIVFSAIFGFIYEVFFYKINDGTFGHRGTLFGPWIPIYGFGGLFISILAYKFKEKPLYVFLISAVISGVLELVTGYLLLHISGIRLWNYNTEIWNWGNVSGYICFRSIMFFAISGLFLVYAVIPLIKYLKKKTKEPLYFIVGFVLVFLFIIDLLLSNLLR